MDNPISECCCESAGDFYDIGICPRCREHCEWIDDSEDEEDACQPFLKLDAIPALNQPKPDNMLEGETWGAYYRRCEMEVDQRKENIGRNTNG